jgi:asparagine synthase (glutamine-hydrolysing)
MWIQDKQAIELFNSAYQFQMINEEKPGDYYSHIVNSFPESTDILNKMLFLEMSGFLPDHNLNYTDKMSMAVGVESRVPFLDLDLAELAFSLPIKYKMRGSTTKYILKKVGERYLSNDVIYRPKTGFGAPVRTWINGLMKPLVDEKLSFERIQARGIFNPEAVRKLIEDNMNGRIDASYTIWSLLAIESWMQQFCD